ncbi:hypothetical protein OG897_16450 [Streptomyces sp. NBC_00237]|uniref:hypothetical protein n=1 Tax=Streptomyces sp. NBC_00237 TaxID=2975687 RepID=UPI0022569040|nr:hypothetical protein [Streptomyces sp. NBC_00237]MCX5203033.1 hypothetical protein [Streptomyces sp. NBC_00237]
MPVFTRHASAAALVAVPLLLLAAPGAGADDKNPPAAAPPAMSIALSNGVDTVSSGSRLAYTVTVHNQGAANLAGLRIEQELPTGASGASADQQAKVAGGKAVWTADVRAHGKTVLTSSATLGTEQAGALRAASTVCAYLPTSQVPVVCSSDMDLLPAGAKAEGVDLADGADGGTVLGMRPGVAIGVLAGAGLLAGGGVLVVRRRKKAAAGGGGLGLG